MTLLSPIPSRNGILSWSALIYQFRSSSSHCKYLVCSSPLPTPKGAWTLGFFLDFFLSSPQRMIWCLDLLACRFWPGFCVGFLSVSSSLMPNSQSIQFTLKQQWFVSKAPKKGTWRPKTVSFKQKTHFLLGSGGFIPITGAIAVVLFPFCRSFIRSCQCSGPCVPMTPRVFSEAGWDRPAQPREKGRRTLSS